MPDWRHIDRQLYTWETKLRDDVGFLSQQARSLASCISTEVAMLTSLIQDRIRHKSPILMERRLDEIIAFDSWMEISHNLPSHPAITRAQVITQNYICFVYLKESWFQVLGDEMNSDTATARCCTFLLSEPIRRFRNAFAHGNWQYLQDPHSAPDSSGIGEYRLILGDERRNEL